MLDADDDLAREAIAVVQSGDLPTLRWLLAEHPTLPMIRIGSDVMSRTLLHAATDYPGHFPNGSEVVTLLLEAGADVNAVSPGRTRRPRCTGPRAAMTCECSTPS